MLTREELPGYRIVTLSRTSNISNKSQSSLDRQIRKLNDEVESLKQDFGGRVVNSYQNKQSASSMDRDTLDEILELANNNKFDILMVWAIHRLTRANPLETMRYMIKLADNDIILYSHRDGYYDWEDPDDITRLMDRISSSRSWRNEIQRGSIAGNREILSEGGWPYGPTGYGLTKDDNDKIRIKDGYHQIIQPMFRAYLKTHDEAITAEAVANKINNDNLGIEPPSPGQIETALENELYIGKLIARKSGELVQQKDSLQVVDPDIYNQTKNLLSETDEDHFCPDTENLPSEIYELISRFGQEYAVENVSAIRWCCPKCESTDINVSDTVIESLGIHIPRIYCKNDDCSTNDEPSYQGPAIRTRELYQIDLSLPFVCPECQRTDGFEVEPVSELNLNQQMYKYTCDHCGESMIKSSDPDPNVRGLNSSNSIRLRSNDSEQPNTEPTEDAQVESDDTDDTDDDGEVQPEVTTVLEEYLERAGPNKAVARDVMVTAAGVLSDDGPMTTSELRSKLAQSHGDQYSSVNSLWESTFARLYSETPGFIKVDYGEYDFDEERLNELINTILKL